MRSVRAQGAPVLWMLLGLMVTSVLVCLCSCSGRWNVLLDSQGEFDSVNIRHPIDGAVFPRNMPSPVVTWNTNVAGVGSWSVAFKAGEVKWSVSNVRPPYRPPETQWRKIKAYAGTSAVEVVVAGIARDNPGHLAARGAVRVWISPDAVDAPLFYRDVNLPFKEAVKDPSKIRWRFGAIDAGKPPPVVLEGLPVCGNCHSFSRDGRFLAMDVDYANSKASYIITRTAREMRLATSDIITWNDFRREDGRQTFGLLSQISPDGRYVLSTVKDRSVFVPKPELAFSQLFFPLKGIIAVYDRQTREFYSLPGADDPAYVQSNPTWSPDGKWVVFARAPAAELEKLRDTASILLTPEECEEFLQRGKEFKYDLYRVPFNDGKGGVAEPIPGASRNGKSNFFPKFSPDGRWIVFCQASNYMLLQPDSQLFIIPAEGGEPRRLACNLGRMNSWHSWSPDGKWLVFASKEHSDYTQLYLSRISLDGEASPAVWLAHMLEPERAANIPEFVALRPDAIRRIREQFLDDYSYTRAGNEFLRAGEPDEAIVKFKKALALNPDNAMAHQRLGFLLFRVKHKVEEAIAHSRRAVELEPENAFARFDLGFAYLMTGNATNAIPHLEAAVRLLPNGYDRQYNAVDMHFALAEAYYSVGRYRDCIPVLSIVMKHAPDHTKANYLMALAGARTGETESTLPYYERSIKADPQLAHLPDYHDLLSRNYFNLGQFEAALAAAQTAYKLAVAAGRQEQAARLLHTIELCRNHLARR